MTYSASYATLRQDDLIIVKQSSESVTSSSTLQDDDEFFFAADANSNYEIQMQLTLACGSATPDFKWAMTTLTSALWMGGGHYRDQDNGGISSNVIPSRAGNTTTLPSIQISSTGDAMWVYLDISYVTLGTSGTVYFRWAQNVSNGTGVSIIAGSYMQVRKIGTNA